VEVRVRVTSVVRTGLAEVGDITVTAIILDFVSRLKEWETVWLLITITGVIVVDIADEAKAFVVQTSWVELINLGTQRVD